MPDPDEADPVAWAAPWPAVVAGLLAAVGSGAWAVAADDPPGRLLTGVAAVALAVAAGIGALARPRLGVDESGLVLRGVTGTRRWPWERVDAVRTVRMRRMGLPASYVEIEARDDEVPDGRLLVLGRLELGTDPVEVADALQRHRARAGRRVPRHGSAGSAPERQGADGDEHDEDHGDPTDGEEPGRRT
ncbi:PH domain-containing protein [Actinomycetospora cinnamomea]|uniref:PH (Pleckstrin Homology) domain-containing protein n=1 Tax=Actinomycetospora cinnamomea TaxID=663609 RepID=A0A2U1FF42_9PSEU|nr:PH domain-containing protein [Actinomycetospora cinnamomea]PVZ10813.1 PH (Pleckstrin Homology) domain-containing protein [Actinomycetospora cinnamomea]